MITLLMYMGICGGIIQSFPVFGQYSPQVLYCDFENSSNLHENYTSLHTDLCDTDMDGRLCQFDQMVMVKTIGTLFSF